jgi:hypothetical protein
MQMYITHLSVDKKVGASSTYFSPLKAPAPSAPWRAQLNQINDPKIGDVLELNFKLFLLLAPLGSRRRVMCQRISSSLVPMSLPDRSILLYIPYVDWIAH